MIRRPECGAAVLLSILVVWALVRVPIGLAFPSVVSGAAARDRVEGYEWSIGNEVRIIDNNRDALMTRLQMIRNAEDSIYMSSYIWRDDTTGRAVFAELVAAAERGVDIRLLGDGMFFLRKTPVVKAMNEAHQLLKLRYYNIVSDEIRPLDVGFGLDLLTSFDSVNHRMHIKLLIVDEEEAVLGGRNVGDEYFGVDEHINFVDRDVHVRGPVVEQAIRCFEAYWQDERSHRLDPYLAESQESAGISWSDHRMPVVEEAIGTQWRTPQRAGIWYDEPGPHMNTIDYQPTVLSHRLVAFLGMAEQRIAIESPYLVLSDRMRSCFLNLRRKNPDLAIDILVNSLASTDSWKGFLAFQKHLRLLLKDLGIRVYQHRPNSFAEVAGRTDVKTGFHSKTYLVDDRWSAVGSYNLDPRSGMWNAEVMLVMDDEAITSDLVSAFEKRSDAQRAWVTAQRPESRAPEGIQSEFEVGEVGTMDILHLDAWYLSDVSCYEWQQGDPVPPSHPEFHNRYRDVGLYPEVGAGRKKRLFIGLLQPLSDYLVPLL